MFKKGYKMSEEHKRKIGIANKGRVPWIAGRKLTEEHRRKIGKANAKALLGRKMPIEVRQKISTSNMGKRPSPESVRKSVEARRGFRHSKETKERLREMVLGRKQSPETIAKRAAKLRGQKKRPMSAQGRENISKSHKGITPWNKGVRGYKVRPMSLEARKKLSVARRGIPNIKGRGEKSHWWKGGITSENDRIRTSLEYKLWRKSVFERDNFTCQKTGQRGGSLVAHHINNFADFPELRTALDNGVTLSVESHRQFHKKYGKKNNTREQLGEYLYE